jgi:coproporphyrinogen III oxidase
MTLFEEQQPETFRGNYHELKNRRADMEYQARDKQLFSRNRGRK